MPSFLKNLIPGLFAVAVFSLIWRYGFPKPFEIFVSLLFFVTAIGICRSREMRKFAGELWRNLWAYRNTLIILFVAVISGTLFSISTFDINPHINEVYLEYFRIVFSIALFFLTVYVTVRYKNSTKIALGAIAVSPIVLLLAFIQDFQGFFTENSRLIGARNDPNYLATFIGLGILISAFYFLYTRNRYRWFGFLAMVFSLPLFLWTGSRSAVVSLALTYVLVGVALLYNRASFSEFRGLALIFILSFALLSASFFILPDRTQALIYERVFGVLGGSLSVGEYDFRAADFSYSRGNLWEEGFSMAAAGPLGFGPAYHNFNPVGYVGRPHSLWLEVMLTAGWIGLFVWLVFVYLVGREAWRLSRDGGFLEVSLFAGFIYLLVGGFFLDMFTLRWLWLIMGMIVGYSYLRNNEKIESISTSADS